MNNPTFVAPLSGMLVLALIVQSLVGAAIGASTIALRFKGEPTYARR
jgi:hypothetical protein